VKIFNHLNSMKKYAEGKPPCEFHTPEIQVAASGETLREGLLFDKIMAIYMSIFHPCFSLMCFKWEVSSFLVMDMYGNSTLGTIKILKLLP